MAKRTTPEKRSSRAPSKSKTPLPDNTGGKRADVGPGKPPVEHQFKPGNKGRPKGSRNRLGEAFLKALADDFDKHGITTIEKVRTGSPVAYVKACVAILPKELNVNLNPLEDMTDEQLIQRIRDLDNALTDVLGGTGGTDHGVKTKDGQKQTGRVPSLH